MKKTVSDLLFRAGSSFARWKANVVDTETQEIENRRSTIKSRWSRLIAMAQGNSWQVAARRKRNRGASLPTPLTSILAAFIGDQIDGANRQDCGWVEALQASDRQREENREGALRYNVND
ncbi:unnamed protein product [Amoebophrya sp. A25]|nr:unnamed protein product [Amoebophrya sp. A25]|eukprot:GSA25T00009892001.1